MDGGAQFLLQSQAFRQQPGAVGHAGVLAVPGLPDFREPVFVAQDDGDLVEVGTNDDDRRYHGPAERAERLEKFTTFEVDLHHWSVTPTPDQYGLAVTHGEYAVSLMFGQRLVGYVRDGSGPLGA